MKLIVEILLRFQRPFFCKVSLRRPLPQDDGKDILPVVSQGLFPPLGGFRTKPLVEYMRAVPDPRCGRETKHDHAEVLVCLVAGFLAGGTTLRRNIQQFQQLRYRFDLTVLILYGHLRCHQPRCREEIVKYFGEMSEDHKRTKEDENYRPRYPGMQEKHQPRCRIHRIQNHRCPEIPHFLHSSPQCLPVNRKVDRRSWNRSCPRRGILY